MLSINKIFYFEMAHAIFGHKGLCRHIHGHRYELHVGVSNKSGHKMEAGMIIDLKLLKTIVNDAVVNQLDHALVLSESWLAHNACSFEEERLLIFAEEPTVENLITYIKIKLQESLPDSCNLIKLKLFETRDSYAEWLFAE